MAFLQYSDTYAKEENLAKAEARGIWDGEFVRPYKFRAGEWEGARDSGECVIKGNINRKGEKIYHALWSRSYKRTRINTAKGERWFCMEDEASAARWQAPYRKAKGNMFSTLPLSSHS